MSRSRRKTPKCSITKGGYNKSEKNDKRIYHSQERARFRLIICDLLNNLDGWDSLILPLKDEITQIYSWNKDGKQYFDPVKHPDCMRK